MTTTQEILTRQKAELRARMAVLRSEIAAHMVPTVSLRAQLEAKIGEHNALGAVIADLSAQIDAIEQPKLHDLKMELSDVARAEAAIKLTA